MRLQVGQMIYIVSLNHRRGADNSPQPAVITKIGRKYFETNISYMGRFEIETMLQDAGKYSSRYRVYLSLQEIEDKKEQAQLYDEIRRHYFSTFSPRLPLETLRKIKEILPQNP